MVRPSVASMRLRCFTYRVVDWANLSRGNSSLMRLRQMFSRDLLSSLSRKRSKRECWSGLPGDQVVSRDASKNQKEQQKWRSAASFTGLMRAQDWIGDRLPFAQYVLEGVDFGSVDNRNSEGQTRAPERQLGSPDLDLVAFSELAGGTDRLAIHQRSGRSGRMQNILATLCSHFGMEARH